MIFQIFGSIENPYSPAGLDVPGYVAAGTQGGALILLFNNLIKLTIVGAGIFAFLNIIVAGYGFLASTDPKEITKAWGRIWQAMLGLLVIAGSFILAAIFGWVIFGDPMALLAPRLFTP